MKRREFVEKLGLGSAALVSASVVAGGAAAAPRSASEDGHDDEQAEGHDHRPMNGSLATATVSFGESLTDPPLDRYVTPNAGNGHQVIPHQVAVRAGGTVNFVIAGLHQVIVYGPGKRPEDVNAGMVRQPPTTPPLIDDPLNRVYAGLNPITQPRDRVEVVQFPNPGRHLVICGVQPHFVNDKMFGYVNVLSHEDEPDK
jgi:plastocyanin